MVFVACDEDECVSPLRCLATQHRLASPIVCALGTEVSHPVDLIEHNCPQPTPTSLARIVTEQDRASNCRLSHALLLNKAVPLTAMANCLVIGGPAQGHVGITSSLLELVCEA